MFRFKEVVLKNGFHEKKTLVIKFNHVDMDIIGEFLMTDASLLDYNVLEKIDSVLSGTDTHEEFTGNRCSLDIKRDKTIIMDLLEGVFDDFELMRPYEINTKKLRDLIIMWKNKMES